ncbi:MAG: hypothetical protein ACREA4_09800, partial [Nitrososphaera sp.]
STIEAQEKIMELREAAIELQEDNLALKQKVKELEDILQKKNAMAFRPPFYYVERDDVPHCPRCWEVGHKAVHFPPPYMTATGGSSYHCVECRTNIVHPRESPSIG